jgi:hypothetical protein
MISVSSFTNSLAKGGSKLLRPNSKTSSMQLFGQNDESSPWEEDISEYGNGKRILYISLTFYSNISLPAMSMCCLIEMYCIVNLMMMRNSLLLLRWTVIQWLLLRGQDFYIFSTPALERSNALQTLDGRLLALPGISRKVLYGLVENMGLLGTYPCQFG